MLNYPNNLLLYGAVELDYATNCKLFDAVHDYIDETGRLCCWRSPLNDNIVSVCLCG